MNLIVLTPETVKRQFIALIGVGGGFGFPVPCRFYTFPPLESLTWVVAWLVLDWGEEKGDRYGIYFQLRKAQYDGTRCNSFFLSLFFPFNNNNNSPSSTNICRNTKTVVCFLIILGIFHSRSSSSSSSSILPPSQILPISYCRPSFLLHVLFSLTSYTGQKRTLDADQHAKLYSYSYLITNLLFS